MSETDFFSVESETVTLRDAVFTFSLKAVDDIPPADLVWRVYRFEAREAVSECWECVVDLVLDDPDADPTRLVGLAATLVVGRPDLDGNFIERSFAGVIRRATRSAVADHGPEVVALRRARIQLVPELWQLSQETDCRIFQNLSVIEIAQAVLGRAGLYAGRLDVSLHQTYAPRECCVQYNETSLDFVQRLLEHEGIAYFFRVQDGVERLVLTDHGEYYARARTLNGEPVRVLGDGAATAAVESLRTLDWTRSVPARRPVLRDYDFTEPGVNFTAPTDATKSASDEFEYPAGANIGGYASGTRRYETDNLTVLARARREQAVGRAVRGHGTGNLTCLAAGTIFAADETGRASGIAPPFLVTSVMHEGIAGDVFPLELVGREGLQDRYSNRFECALLRETRADGTRVPLPYRPPRVTPRPMMQGLHSATVVADPTAPKNDIALDEYGRVRVRFPWDRQEHDAVGADAGWSSAWIRTMQPWAGMGFGHVFVPRVGMEVVVSFLDGDPDRPVVLGSLYNGQNPPPTAPGVEDLRRDATRSTLRTRSSPYGNGYNELAFEDAIGREEVFLRAERDLNEVVRQDHTETVGRDHSLRVRHDETIHVSGDQTQTVLGHQRESVVGNQVLMVESSRNETVRVNRAVRVEGDQEHRVEGNDAVTVSGNADRFFVQGLSTRVGGRAHCEVTGAVDESVHDDRTERVRGHRVTIVGRYEAKRSSLLHVEGASSFWSSETTEIHSEKDILLRCGRSMIRLTPERLELISPEVIVRGGENSVTVSGDKVRVRGQGELILGAPKVVVKSSGAAVKLDSEAKVMGAKVNLGTGSIPLDNDPDDPVELTTIVLKDHAGNPLPHERFVIRIGDGSEQTGIVNHEGKATVLLEADAEIAFPELRSVEEA